MNENTPLTINAHRVAITTKFFGPTNTRGSRIKAQRADAGTGGVGNISVTVPYDHALGHYENHAAAVEALVKHLDWTGYQWLLGGTSTGYVAVAVPR